jgi:hypothetical protein
MKKRYKYLEAPNAYPSLKHNTYRQSPRARALASEQRPMKACRARKTLGAHRYHPYAIRRVEREKMRPCTSRPCVSRIKTQKRVERVERVERAKTVERVETSNIYSLADLVRMIRQHPKKIHVTYEPDMDKFHRALPHLVELDAMVGHVAFKNRIVDQVVYYCQGLDAGAHEYRHTVLTGAPGTGKTEIAAILGRLYASLGILKKQTVHCVTRADMVGGYLGQTALKTRDAVEKALDGVLFIDEAYSLGGSAAPHETTGGGSGGGGSGGGGSGGGSDSFSVECLDTLCELLSRYRERLIVILAGYKHEIDTRLFRTNPGLRSRFMWWYDLPDYSPKELAAIMRKNVHDVGWRLRVDAHNDVHNDAPHETGDALVRAFEQHHVYFEFNGRDVVNFLTMVKIAHSKRLFANTGASSSSSSSHLSRSRSGSNANANASEHKNEQENEQEKKQEKKQEKENACRVKRVLLLEDVDAAFVALRKDYDAQLQNSAVAAQRPRLAKEREIALDHRVLSMYL